MSSIIWHTACNRRGLDKKERFTMGLKDVSDEAKQAFFSSVNALKIILMVRAYFNTLCVNHTLGLILWRRSTGSVKHANFCKFFCNSTSIRCH